MRKLRVKSAGGATGRDVFLALSKLDELLSSSGDGQQVEGLPLNTLAPAEETGDVGYVQDFRLVPAAGLCSELFTAKAAGEILVGMGICEGVILDDPAQGLGVLLRPKLSPVLGNLIEQFNECLARVNLCQLLSSLPADGGPESVGRVM